MKPAQLPHPPLWYAVPVPEGAAWPAQNRINIVCGGPMQRVREITDRYRAEWAAAGNSPDQLPLLGINRFVVAADTDREAMELGRRAWPDVLHEFHEALEQARHPAALCPHARGFRHGGARTAARIAGSPGTIREQVRRMADEAGANYFISQFSFGDLTQQEVLHSAGISRARCCRARERVAQAVRGIAMASEYKP